ncbi:MAG: GNAT family N-acetyltransferase [Kiritimatiellae bacterium]|nr:GNAT family N-acetyltransferase [Kiritimatiellia bacterium]
MIKLAKADNLPQILDYIGNERGKCLYLYMDILKYGIGHPEIQVWMQQDNGGTVALAMRYRNGIHVYSAGNNYVPGEIVDLIRQVNPTMVCGEKTFVQTLSKGLPEYGVDNGEVVRLAEAKADARDPEVSLAQNEDFLPIAQMLKDDEDYGAPFSLEELEFQFRSRQESGLSRSYVLKIGGEVVAHAATAAESSDLTTLNGFVVRRDQRRKGYATRVINTLCADLQTEGKAVFSIYYVEQSAKLHHKLGFVKYCGWCKLFKKV